jgi:hypothetical protein
LFLSIVFGGLIYAAIDNTREFHESARVCVTQGCSVVGKQCLCMPGMTATNLD